ncbi:pinin [Onthophagus taurus]|uniref:pinin n=1 Tax=Onthophagus taurus TaxID=166361 RepID=UPI0039BE047F
MATEILKSFGTLQSELEQARSSLKGVDESIKRLIGRDPSDVTPRALAIKRSSQPDDIRGVRQRGSTTTIRRPFNHENDEPINKRRSSVFKRLSDKPNNQYDEEELKQPQKQMISKIIVTPKEIPSRQEALAAQNKDEKSKARNRRMFGALLGTLQKFQQEETKLKSKEDKRAQLEKKIEEHEIREKAEIKKERQELFFNRKKKQAEIRMIELKMTRMKEYSLWEERQKPRMHFIQTKAKPQICYLPRKLNEVNKTALEECKNEIEKMIDKKRQDVFDDLQQIEERMKKNFEKKGKDVKQSETQDELEGDDDKHHEDLYDEEINDVLSSEVNIINNEDENKDEEKTNGKEETVDVNDESKEANVENVMEDKGHQKVEISQNIDDACVKEIIEKDDVNESMEVQLEN